MLIFSIELLELKLSPLVQIAIQPSMGTVRHDLYWNKKIQPCSLELISSTFQL